MIIKVRRGEEVLDLELDDGATVADVYAKLKVLGEEYVPVVDGRVVSDCDILEDGDELRLIRAFSGG